MAISPAERDDTSHDTEALYREHGAAVAALCRSLLRERGDTEDATQQVFLSAHRALLNGVTPREPRAWLLAVARNECYARFRERASRPAPAGDAPETLTADASVHVLRAGELENVWDEVGQMPATQREAFLLREIRGLSYGQVADELSLSGASVRSLLLRARMRLRERLGDVAAGLGGVPWVQALLRLFASGDAASPVPVATKAAAVGIGALALAGGGGLVAHHAATAHHASRHHRAQAHVHHVAQAPIVAATPAEDRPRLENRGSDDLGAEVEHSRGRDGGGSRDSSERSRGRGGHASSESSGSSGHDGSGDATVVTQSASSVSDGGGSSSSGPGPSGSSSSGSGDSGSDGGSGAVTTATSSGSDSGSSGSSGSDGSGSGSGGGGGSDDGGGHDGSTH